MKFTVLEGTLKTSPIPPPLRKPLFKVVTIHIIRLLQECSLTVVGLSSLSATGFFHKFATVQFSFVQNRSPAN